MGQPAARITDPTSHGNPLPGPGFPTVKIKGLPAWRVGDFFPCPLVNVLVPHVGGVVAAGSLTVIIGGQPAARLGDIIVEIPGGPNAIASGEPTVLIG